MPNKTEKVGVLRERIVLESVSEARSSTGHPVQTWSTLATVWAKLEYVPVFSDERNMTDRKTAEQTVVFTIRYRTDITINEKVRILYNSQYYDITAVAVMPDKFYMTLTAQKRN